MIFYHILNDSVVLNYDGKTTTVHASDSRYAEVLAAIRERRTDEIPSIVDVSDAFKDSRLALVDGLVNIDGQPLPEELSKRVLDFKEKRLPYDALVAFWDNLRLNPSFNARKMLYKFLEHNGHPLTEDGHFIAYRGVTEDFKDIHTKTFDNSPGSVVEMDRQSVDDNPNNTCSSGLHVACHEYAKGFGPKLIEVKVNPRDVVAVPTDYNGTKMRVCRFEVVREGENLRTETLYTDDQDESDELFCENCGETQYSEADHCPECGEEY